MQLKKLIHIKNSEEDQLICCFSENLTYIK